MIPYGSQHISDADIDAVVEVLRSDFLTQGPCVPKFEEKLCEYSGMEFGVAFNSATSALHGACLAMGISAKSRVWVPAISFVASANCAEYCGAKVEFIDVELDTACLSMEFLENKLRLAELEGTLPDLVIAVHYAGQYCDMATLKVLSQRFHFRVIEDASHALGAEPPEAWGGAWAGDIRVYSFHPVKMITTAEGGVALTDDRDLAESMRMIACHGIQRDKDKWQYPESGEWYYEQQTLGFNYRMNDVQAALGISQLQQLPGFLKRRREIAAIYELNINLRQRVNQGKYGLSSYHLFPVLIDEQISDRVFSELKAAGIGVQKHYIPILNQPYYRDKYHYPLGSCPQAQQFYRQTMSLPIFPDLADQDQQYVLEQLSQFL